MKPIKFQLQKPFKRADLPGKDFPWDSLPEGSILPNTQIDFSGFSVVIKDADQGCLRCATGVKIVNFKNLQKMLNAKSSILLEIKATVPGTRILSVGAQYAVEGIVGCQFTARLDVQDNLGNQLVDNAGNLFEDDRGETIDVMNGRAVFLGVKADPGEKIQILEFSVNPKPGFVVNGIYINGLRVQVG